MQHLILCPGPKLLLRGFRPDPGDVGGRPNETDVSDRAQEFLFELVTVHPETTLADIFSLLEASPLLQRIYRRDLVEELCAEARNGPEELLADATYEGIEFLELYQQWGLDTSTNEYSGAQHLQLHGIGRELAEDRPQEGKKKGERIEWSVGLTPLRKLLSLPVRVNAEVRVTEEDPAAKAHLSEIKRVRNADVSLGQVIDSLLWELSFHGGPQEQREVLEGLKRQLAEINDGTAQLVSHDDLFGHLDKPGCDALFDDLGGRSTSEIGKAIRDIDDDQNAAADLERVFDGEVVVKAQFRDLCGREFRKAFQAA
jgi:hypothetical protein